MILTLDESIGTSNVDCLLLWVEEGVLLRKEKGTLDRSIFTTRSIRKYPRLLERYF